MSPSHDTEALIKSSILPTVLPSGEVSVVGKGKKTVDFHQIRERFNELGVHVEWKRVEKLRLLRNDIEHYYTNLSRDNVKELLATSLVLIRDFLSKELKEDPLDSLGEDCWNTLLEISEIYAKEKDECRESLSKVSWKYNTLEGCTEHFRCTSCNSDLVKTDESGEYKTDIPLVCNSCGNVFVVEEVIEPALEELLGFLVYQSIKDGDEPPFGNCPHCHMETYVFSECICIRCEDKLEFENCVRCDAELSIDEQDLSGLCGYCNHMLEKA